MAELTVPAWVHALSPVELADQLGRGGVHREVVEKVLKKKIAGRHLEKLLTLSDEALERYNLSLGDVLDIVETLQKQEERPNERLSSPELLDGGKKTSERCAAVSQKSPVSNWLRPIVNNQNGSSCSWQTDFIKSPLPSQANTKRPSEPEISFDSLDIGNTEEEIMMAKSLTPSINSGNSSNINEASSFKSPSDIDTDDETFNGFATREQVKCMSKLERKSAKAKIQNYQTLIEQGLKGSKPYLHLPGEEGLKKKAKTSGESSKEKTPSKRKESKTSDSEESDDQMNKRRKSRRRNDNDLDTSEDSDEEGNEDLRKKSKQNKKRKRKENGSDYEYERTDKENRKKKRKKRKDNEDGEERDNKKKHKKNKKKKNDVSKSFKVSIPEHLQDFLEADCLDESQKASIQKYLQSPLNRKFNIREILNGEGNDKDEQSDDEETSPVQELIKSGVVFDDQLRKVVALLMKYLYKQVSDPSLITSELRESLAVSFVATFPKMAQERVRDNDLPWSWLFDRRHNSGKLAHHHATQQKQKESTRLRGGGKKKKTQKKKEPSPPTPQYLLIDDVPLSKDAKHLGFIVPDDNERPEIERLMNVTYEERRALVANPSCPITLILQAFKHLKSFEGRMIDLEFEKIYGQEKGHLFLRNFQDLTPRLYKIAKQDIKKYNPETCFMFGDSVLNSLLILSKYLPLPKRVYPWEEKMDIVPITDTLVEVVPVGSSLKEKIESKRARSESAVQPYILATGTHKKIESLSIVLGDSHVIKLPNDSLPLRAVDLLIKSHFVLGSHFCLGWKNVYRFLSTHIFKLPPENPRLSVFMAEYKKLTLVQVD